MTASSLPDCVRFHDTELSIIDRDGVPWLTSADLGRALGYLSSDEVGRLYRRNKDEFSDDMALTVKLTGRGQVAPTNHRVFSPRGCHLIAMFARTDRAKEFRRWVLDVLEGLEKPAPAPHPDAVSSFHFSNDQVAALKADIVRDVTRDLAERMPSPGVDMPRVNAGHALFAIAGKRVIVDTRDGNPARGDRAVVVRCEGGGRGPELVTILGDPPVPTWFDRCKIYDSGVRYHIPVGVVIGRVVWEGV